MPFLSESDPYVATDPNTGNVVIAHTLYVTHESSNSESYSMQIIDNHNPSEQDLFKHKLTYGPQEMKLITRTNGS